MQAHRHNYVNERRSTEDERHDIDRQAAHAECPDDAHCANRTERARGRGGVLVETDAPFLAPIPLRGKRNEPAFVAHTAAAVAKLRGVGVADLAAQTTDNFFRLFTRADRGRLAAG